MPNKFRDHIELSEKLIACLHFPSHIQPCYFIFSIQIANIMNYGLTRQCRNVAMKVNSLTLYIEHS